MITRPRTRLPRVITLLAVNGCIGAAIGISAAGLLLLSDAGGLATLIGQSGTGTQIAATAMLFGSFALTFSSLAMASAVMLLPRQ